MSLHIAAQHLASRGRGPDTTLVHMAPSEVAGLQALAKAHGGSLTLNPDTGLPEAGFLSSILPAVIGLGVTAATGGAAAPWMIGLGVGGLEAARTGSLSKGLMAGLGAYGGAGLGAGMGLGAAEAAASALPAEAGAGLGAGTTGAAGAANYSILPQSQYALSAPAGVGEGLRMGATEGLKAAVTPLNEIGSEAVKMAVPTVTPPPESVSALDKLSAMPTSDKWRYGLAALAPVMGGMTPQQAQYQGSGPNPYNFAFDWERPSGPSYDSREALQLRGNLRRLAAGGPIEAMSEQNAAETLMANGGQMYADGGETKADVAQGMTGASADAFRYLMGQAAQSPATQAAQRYATQAPAMAPMNITPQAPSSGGFRGLIERVLDSQNNAPQFSFNPRTGVMQPVQTVTQMAGGGIAALAAGGESHLGDYSDGGRLLKGPGDGVSDSIPATIADKRPARLADGEFVVPARIVSELGNGSTDAGARKLYAMMDRIQKARNKTTGKDRVAVDSRADKALPA